MDQAQFPWRPLGTLLADEGLLTERELEHALTEQEQSGRLLGEILVANGYLTGWTLTRVLAQQHGVDLHTTREIASTPSGRSAAWRPLGRLLVETGVLSDAQLEDALTEQRDHGRRLGEVLIARGLLSAPALAHALALQQGVELEVTDGAETFEAAIRPTAVGEPVYQVCEIRPGPSERAGSVLYETTNFLEAADFAFEFVAEQNPHALEIHRAHGADRESVWTYSEERAAKAAASRKELVETYGFDPIRWNAGARRD
jgi:hypothetical protein